MNVIFLDRDDTLNEDPGYLNDPTKVKLLPNVVEGLRRLHDAGYHFIILTNQSGVGRGRITLEQLEAVHRRLLTKLESQSVPILDIFFCPHTDDDRCDCRKPAAGLLQKALQNYPHIDLKHSWIVGDRYRDLEPALHIGSETVLKGILVGNKEEPVQVPPNLVYRVADLNEAATRILSEAQG